MAEHGLWIILGAAALVFGAECLVRGASGIAAATRLHPAIPGMLIVTIGNSSPELFVTTQASLNNLGDLAIGTVIGSNIFNVGIILGVAAILRPLKVSPHWLKSDIPLMLAIMLAVPFILANGRVVRWEGIALLAASVLYLFLNSLAARRAHGDDELHPPRNEAAPPGHLSIPLAVCLLIAGISLLVAGSRLLINYGMAVAASSGISEATLGLTIVAAVTCLPELFSSLAAARRGESDIVLSNVIGSNIFNILGVLGIAATVAPFRGCGLCHADVFLMIGFSALLIPLLWTGRGLNRIECFFLVAAYAAYIAFRCSMG